MQKIDHIKINWYQGKCKHIFLKISEGKHYEIKEKTKRKNMTIFKTKQNTSHLLRPSPPHPPPPPQKKYINPHKAKIRFLKT